MTVFLIALIGTVPIWVAYVAGASRGTIVLVGCITAAVVFFAGNIVFGVLDAFFALVSTALCHGMRKEADIATEERARVKCREALAAQRAASGYAAKSAALAAKRAEMAALIEAEDAAAAAPAATKPQPKVPPAR